MKKIKGLLYCCKAKPSLMKYENIDGYYTDTDPVLDKRALLNGKIVAECDFDVDEITNCGTSFMIMKYDDLQDNYKYTNEIARGSCLDYIDLRGYLGTNNGYAIHIKNLHIFYEPRNLYDCLIHPKIEPRYYGCEHLSKAPQNMMYVELDDIKYILISIKSERLCKILNGEKTIVVRRKVLKEMLENEFRKI